MTFENKVAIVTGSGTGLGAAVASRLAAEGARVAINYSKSRKEAEATKAAIEAKGGKAIVCQADISDDGACRRLAAAALDAWGRIDILVNNAGNTRFVAHDDLDGLSGDDFLAVYKVNVVGAYQMIRAAAPAMRKAGKGAVVNISSIAGVTGIGSSVAYAASKGALNTMTLSLARSLAPLIRVNAVCPGFIGTRWFSDQYGEQKFQAMIESQKKSTPLARAGTAEDIATAVVFFCGEGSDHMTGQTLMPDAGLHLGFAPTVAR